MSESQGNNTFNPASSNMPNLNVAPNSGATPTLPPSNNMPFTASPAKPQPAPQPIQAMPQVGMNASSTASANSVPTAPQANALNTDAQLANPVATPAPQPATPTPQAVPTNADQPLPQPTPGKKVKKDKKAKKTKKTSTPNANATTATPATSNGRQIDFFAEQNARAAERKAKKNKIVKRVVIIGSIVVVLAVAGVVLWFMLNSNSNEVAPQTPTPTATADVLSEARDLYTASGGQTISTIPDETANKAADEYFDKALENANGNDAVTGQVLLAQLIYYYNQENFGCKIIPEYESRINADELSASDRSTLYNIYSLCYKELGDADKADQYNFLSYKLAVELDKAAREDN